MAGEGIDLKFARARQLLDALDLEIDAFLANDLVPVNEVETDTGDLVHWVRVRRNPPLHWSALVGDAIHNARSALDHLAWALVELDGGVPGEHTYFPIGKQETGYGKSLRSALQGTRPETRDSVRALRPWGGGDDQLWLLHQLDILDKHRLLVPVGAAQTGVIMEVTATPPWAEGESTQLAIPINSGDIVYPLYDGAEFLRVQPAAMGENEFHSFKYEPKVMVVFGDDNSPVDGQPVRVLRELVEHAAEVVDPLVGRLRAAAPTAAATPTPVRVHRPISIIGMTTATFGLDDS